MNTLILAAAVLISGGAQQPPAPKQPPAPAAPANTTPAPAPTTPAPTAPAAAQQPPPAKPPVDPSVEQIIKDLEKASPKREAIRAADPTPGGKPVASAKDEATAQAISSGRLLPEGTFLVSRRGRMVKTRAGEWAFVFDADSAGKADPAMILQPCMQLQQMEKAAASESVTLTVSGQVFLYHGRNYLLPTLSVVNRVEPNLNK